jgi:acyl-coenzyme A synthetase/AMP-(fatty) acid ligase
VAVYFVDALPRTAANKIDKLALRRTAADSAGQVRMGGEQ